MSETGRFTSVLTGNDMPQLQVQLDTVELLLAEQPVHADDEAPRAAVPKAEGDMLPAPHLRSAGRHASLLGAVLLSGLKADMLACLGCAAMLLRKACRATRVHLVQLQALLGCFNELFACLSMLGPLWSCSCACRRSM